MRGSFRSFHPSIHWLAAMNLPLPRIDVDAAGAGGVELGGLDWLNGDSIRSHQRHIVPFEADSLYGLGWVIVRVWES